MIFCGSNGSFVPSFFITHIVCVFIGLICAEAVISGAVIPVRPESSLGTEIPLAVSLFFEVNSKIFPSLLKLFCIGKYPPNLTLTG